MELLIVIAILAVLGAMVIFLLNPAETLRKARDSQRFSDLATIKTAVGIYLASKTAPSLDGQSGANINEKCASETTPTIWYSVPSSETAISDTTLGTFATSSQATSSATVGLTDGSGGWIKINLNSLIGSSPISNFPIDPVNTIVSGSAVTSADLVYRYTCKKSPLGFEINATLESEEYATSSVRDGGNNSLLYEVGTDLTILPSTSDF